MRRGAGLVKLPPSRPYLNNVSLLHRTEVLPFKALTHEFVPGTSAEGSWPVGNRMDTPCHFLMSLPKPPSLELSSEPQDGDLHTGSASDLKPSSWQPSSFVLSALLFLLAGYRHDLVP